MTRDEFLTSCAEALQALINSKASSPSRDEIVAAVSPLLSRFCGPKRSLDDDIANALAQFMGDDETADHDTGDADIADGINARLTKDALDAAIDKVLASETDTSLAQRRTIGHFERDICAFMAAHGVVNVGRRYSPNVDAILMEFTRGREEIAVEVSGLDIRDIPSRTASEWHDLISERCLAAIAKARLRAWPTARTATGRMGLRAIFK